MLKREKKHIINTLNRLNEEDESVQQLVSLTDAESPDNDITLDHLKLRLCVDGVFKSVPACEPPAFLDASKRVEFLEQILINRLVHSQLGENEANEKTLRLHNLNLTNKVLNEFSFDSIKLNHADKITHFEYNLSKIRMIDLGRNMLNQIPLSILNLFTGRLETIDLSSNNFESFNISDFHQFTSLKEINLSHNALKTIQNEPPFNFLIQLERLNLSNNNLKTSTSFVLTQLKSLKYLNLSNNEFSIRQQDELNGRHFPWEQLKNLTELNLSCNNKQTRKKTANRKISTLKNGPLFFNSLTSLKILDLSENSLHNIPSDIKDLPSLEELYLDRNFLEFIPNEITELKRLRILSLNENLISEVSDLFCSYAKFRNSLSKLNLSKNKIKNETFSFKVVIFEKMKCLDLSQNLFELIPNPLPIYLEELNLSLNRVKSLMVRPLTYDVKNDPDLISILNMSHEKNTDANLPHVFFMRKLKKLELRDNRIQEIPSDFGVLNSSLEHLDLGANLLTQLCLCRGLGNLRFLSLDSNQIRELPDKIRELTNLEYLNVSKNRILKLNYEICNDLKSLKVLLLNENNLEQLPLFVPNRRPASSSQHETTSSLSSIKKSKFTFNLASLRKVSLDANKLIGNFSLHSTFGLCANLEELSLNSNRINFIEEASLENFVDQENMDEEQIKTIFEQKFHKLEKLKSINLSNNQIIFTEKGGFLKLLINLFKLAPNLEKFVYEQENGVKLFHVSDENFDFNFELKSDPKKPNKKIIDKFISDLNKVNLDLLIDKLEVLDLSNNNLKKLPAFVYKLRNLKELYFNGNELRRIPVEMYLEPAVDDEKEFRELKKLQELVEESRRKKKVKRRLGDEDENEENNEEEEEEEGEENLDDFEEEKIKSKSKKNKAPAQNLVSVKETVSVEKKKKSTNLISEKIEVLQLSNNKIEHVPVNLFSTFSCLKEIKLAGNPLKEPPEPSVCINSKLNGKNDLVIKRSRSMLTSRISVNTNSTTITLLNGPSKTTDDLTHGNKAIMVSFDAESKLSLPGFESMESLKPLQSYMFNHKKREEMLLCNMFMLIKDTIDSQETLLKIMRRLKMPMERVEYVCKDILMSVSKNWAKIAASEFPGEPGKLRPGKKELHHKMNEYALKLQTWNLLNAWRNVSTGEGLSDELLRIIKLMNSNQNENLIYEKLYALKLRSNMFRL